MSFSRLIRFETEDGETKFADLGPWETPLPKKGSQVKAFSSVDELTLDQNGTESTISKVYILNLSRETALTNQSFLHQFPLRECPSTVLD